jgi:hypothetical protein
MKSKIKKESTMKVFGLKHIHENTSIQFTNDGLIMASGVNIKPEIVSKLVNKPGEVYRGESMYVYRRFMDIPAALINKSTIVNAQKTLLKYAQNDINSVL